jgi:hypothetical protein
MKLDEGRPKKGKEGIGLKMSHDACDWLNRIGLILGFLSFWFAAPEFIGEERLKSWEQSAARTLSFVVFVLELFAGSILIGSTLLRFVYDKWIIGVPMFIGWVFVFQPKPIKRFVSWVVAALANDRKVRQRSLFIGAVMLTISFVLQLVATFPKA